MTVVIEQDLTMKIVKGTTGFITLGNIPDIFNNGIARLVIKQNVNSLDSSAPINITNSIIDNSVKFDLSVAETSNLETRNTGINRYKWGVRGTDPTGKISENFVPSGFDKIPDCEVYPEIGGIN